MGGRGDDAGRGGCLWRAWHQTGPGATTSRQRRGGRIRKQRRLWLWTRKGSPARRRGGQGGTEALIASVASECMRAGVLAACLSLDRRLIGPPVCLQARDVPSFYQVFPEPQPKPVNALSKTPGRAAVGERFCWPGRGGWLPTDARTRLCLPTTPCKTPARGSANHPRPRLVSPPPPTPRLPRPPFATAPVATRQMLMERGTRAGRK